jgi:hypothetical protein
MRTPLAELFARTQGAPQNVEGTMVHSIYRRGVASGQLVLIRRIRAIDTPTQGLRVKVDKGTVTVHGQKLKEAVLWARQLTTGSTSTVRSRQGGGRRTAGMELLERRKGRDAGLVGRCRNGYRRGGRERAHSV